MPAIQNVLAQGIHSARPAAGSAVQWSYYYETDTLNLYQTTGSAWTLIGSSGGFANPMTTKGDVIVGGASGTPARLAVGTDGYVLTARSGATDGVDWEAAGGGGAVTQLGQTVVTGSPAATLASPTLGGSYSKIGFTLTCRSTGAVVTSNVLCQFNGDTATNYEWNLLSSQNGVVNSAGAQAATSIIVGTTIGASGGGNSFGQIDASIIGYASAANGKTIVSQGYAYDGTTQYQPNCSGWWAGIPAITSIVLSLASGSFAIGTVVTWYGWT